MAPGTVFLSSLLNSVITITVFSLIPLVSYFNGNANGTICDFVNEIGLFLPKRANWSRILAILALASVLSFGITCSTVILGLTQRQEGQSYDFTALTLAIYLLFHALRTGIGEEVLFRGFIAKRLIKRLGLLKGNLIQALLFGLVHLLFVGSAPTTIDLLVKVLNASILGFAYGYVMKKYCDGSIVPGIVAHGLYNIFASVSLALIYSLLVP